MKIDYANLIIGQCPNCNKNIANCECKPKPKIESKELIAITLLIIGLLIFAYLVN